MKHKIVLGITGASGAIYAKILLQKLTKSAEQIEDVGVVISDAARQVWKFELEEEALAGFNFKVYDTNNFNAPFASGSAHYNTMIVCPCSMGTLARIANGISESLISRAADVILKERRKLILVVRDTPYNLIHINNMKTITEAGGIICPASPSYYCMPKNIEELASTVVNRVLDLAGISIDGFKWGENSE